MISAERGTYKEEQQSRISTDYDSQIRRVDIVTRTMEKEDVHRAGQSSRDIGLNLLSQFGPIEGNLRPRSWFTV